MQHINIESVETQAAEYEAFASHPGLADFEAADYRARAENLREFARMLRAHRRVDAQAALNAAALEAARNAAAREAYA